MPRKDCRAEPSHHFALEDIQRILAPTTKADFKGNRQTCGELSIVIFALP